MQELILERYAGLVFGFTPGQSTSLCDLKLARQLFMRDHKTMFRVLASMRNAYYRSDEWCERFVSLCDDIDVQRLTFEAYMNKRLVRARPPAQVKIGLKNLAHLVRIVPECSL